MCLKGGISIDADSGPIGYVLWCCGSRSWEVLTFFQIGSGHTVILKKNVVLSIFKCLLSVHALHIDAFWHILIWCIHEPPFYSDKFKNFCCIVNFHVPNYSELVITLIIIIIGQKCFLQDKISWKHIIVHWCRYTQMTKHTSTGQYFFAKPWPIVNT